MITEEMFKKATGGEPVDDDLERCNCEKAGQFGHSYCGWCGTHNKPVFMCGCTTLINGCPVADLVADQLTEEDISGLPNIQST